MARRAIGSPVAGGLLDPRLSGLAWYAFAMRRFSYPVTMGPSWRARNRSPRRRAALADALGEQTALSHSVWCLYANERTALETLQGFLPAYRALDRLHSQRTESGDAPCFGELRPNDLRVCDGTVFLPGLALLDDHPGRGVSTDRRQLANLVVQAVFGEEVSDVKGAFERLPGANSDSAENFREFVHGVQHSQPTAEILEGITESLRKAQVVARPPVRADPVRRGMAREARSHPIARWQSLSSLSLPLWL